MYPNAKLVPNDSVVLPAGTPTASDIIAYIPGVIKALEENYVNGLDDDTMISAVLEAVKDQVKPSHVFFVEDMVRAFLLGLHLGTASDANKPVQILEPITATATPTGGVIAVSEVLTKDAGSEGAD
ncbi:MAG: hypothetical protein ACREO5_00875 [Candidatus Binatia bacterium]